MTEQFTKKEMEYDYFPESTEATPEQAGRLIESHEKGAITLSPEMLMIAERMKEEGK